MTSRPKYLITLHYIPTHIREQLEEVHRQGLHEQVLFSHTHNTFTTGKKKTKMHYFHPQTAERLDVRVYKSPVDRPSTCGTKTQKAIIITARGRCFPKPVLLARCPGHLDVLKVWHPDSSRVYKIVKWPSKRATRTELQERIKVLGKQAVYNAIAAEARRSDTTMERAAIEPSRSPVVYDLGATNSRLPITEDHDTLKHEVDQGFREESPELAAEVATALPATNDIVDLTGDDDLASAQVKQEVIDEGHIKNTTVIFFMSAVGVIARKTPLSEVANARSLYLHFTTAFTLDTTQDVLMLARVNGGQVIRLVSNCKGDFETLWLAVKNDMCWYNGSEARVMCKVYMSMG